MFFAPFYRLSNGFYCLSLLSSQQSWVLFHNYYNFHTCQTAFSIEFLFYLFISTTSHQCWNRLYFTLKKWVLFPPLTVQIYQHFSVDILTCIHRYARAFQITWASFNFVWNFLPSCDELQVTNGSRFRDNTYKLFNIFIYIYIDGLWIHLLFQFVSDAICLPHRYQFLSSSQTIQIRPTRSCMKAESRLGPANPF